MSESVPSWWPEAELESWLSTTRVRPLWEGTTITFKELQRRLQLCTPDMVKLMTTAKVLVAADWGTYAGLFVRMTWHARYTARGRRGAWTGPTFCTLNSWPETPACKKQTPFVAN